MPLDNFWMGVSYGANEQFEGEPDKPAIAAKNSMVHFPCFGDGSGTEHGQEQAQTFKIYRRARGSPPCARGGRPAARGARYSRQTPQALQAQKEFPRRRRPMRNVAQASACQGALRACATGPIQPLNECGASFSAC